MNYAENKDQQDSTAQQDRLDHKENKAYKDQRGRRVNAAKLD
jgi:hypothetical protein